jgi:hypothetical protein
MDFSTRYFLRRLAQARREPNNATAGVAYFKALSETVLLVPGLPAMAVFSWIVIASLRIAPRVAASYGLHPRLAAVGSVALAMTCGYVWFHSRFKHYRIDPSASLNFDSEHDREIIFWQKVSMTALCGAILPLLAAYLFLF